MAKRKKSAKLDDKRLTGTGLPHGSAARESIPPAGAERDARVLALVDEALKADAKIGEAKCEADDSKQAHDAAKKRLDNLRAVRDRIIDEALALRSGRPYQVELDLEGEDAGGEEPNGPQGEGGKPERDDDPENPDSDRNRVLAWMRERGTKTATVRQVAVAVFGSRSDSELDRAATILHDLAVDCFLAHVGNRLVASGNPEFVYQPGSETAPFPTGILPTRGNIPDDGAKA